MKKLFSIYILLLCQLAAIAQTTHTVTVASEPDTPEGGNTTHTVTVACDPIGACRLEMYYGVNYTYSQATSSAMEAPEGSEVIVNVFPVTGFVLDSLVADGTQLTIGSAGYNNGKRGYFTMPDHDVNVVAYHHYAPTLPPNPNESGWDESTGTLTVNHFTPGQLLSAINMMVNKEYSKVKAITVIGSIKNNDWDDLLNFSDLAYIDISQTVGLSETSYDSWTRAHYPKESEPLATLLLPSTITTIGNRTFYNYTALRNITCFAATPPKVYEQSFYGVPTDAQVFVPAESLPLYMAAEGWKDFDLQPITQGVHKLVVNIPFSQTSVLKDMFLELTNTQTAQTQRYVLTSQTTYTYNNLIDDTEYSIYIRNARGHILATIENVKVKGSDVSVAFSQIATPRNIALQLNLPDGTPAETSAYTVTWTDERGNYLAKGTTLDSQLDGTKVKAQIRLEETLGTLYKQPADTLVTVGQNPDLPMTLTPLPQVTLAGTVTAATTTQPIRGANIAVTQLLNGLYSRTLTTTTDAEGHWTLTASEAPTQITASALGYVPLTIEGNDSPADFVLRDLEGTTIRLNLYYRPAVRANEDSVSDDDYYDDYDDYDGYQDISYTVYDETHNQELTSFTVQNGLLVLQDQQLAEGTQLRITATSTGNDFAPASSTCTIGADGESTAILPLVQLGQLKATFSQTDNSNVAGMLYNTDGQLLGMSYYETPDEGSPLLSYTDLPDGHYTLITMGESPLYNFVNTLDAFTEMGLKEGRDYVKNEQDIAAGRIDSLHNQLIPMFDESVFTYTGEGTGFRANKQLLTIGTIVTLQTIVTFKPQVEPADVTVQFDLPDGCQFIEGSVMAGNSLATYEFSNGRLRVPLTRIGDQVRFCVAPVVEGVYAPTASVSFSSGGKNVMQSLGTAIFTAQALSIEAPQQTPSGVVNVSGAAPGGSQVMIYDNGMLIGQTEASVAGIWQQQCLLSEPYNLTEHDIYAVATTTDGLQLQSETRTVAVVHGTLSPVVTMSFVATGSQQVVTWDFRGETVTPTRYVCQDTNMREPMGFDIDFVDDDGEVANDTTIISNVVLYVVLEDNSTLTLYPRYNTKKACWHAAYNIVTTNMPVTVYVECMQDDDLKADRRMMDNILAEAEAAIQDDKQTMRDIYALFDNADVLEEQPVFDELHTLLRADSIDSESMARIDMLVNSLLEDEDGGVETKPYPKQKEEDELHELLQNDDVSEATMQRIFELLAYLQEDEPLPATSDTDLQALTDSINAWFGVLHDEVMAWQELTATTDTTQWKRPEGDIAFDILLESGGVKKYNTKKLSHIDREQLLAEGYTEQKLNDGTSVFYLFSGEKTCFVDTRNSMQYTTEVVKDEAAKARRAKGSTAFTGILNKDCWSNFKIGVAAHITKTDILLSMLSPESTIYDVNSTYIPQTCSLLGDLNKSIKCVYEDAIKNLEEYAKKYFKEHTDEADKKIKNASNNVQKQKEKVKQAEDLLQREQQRSKDLINKREPLLNELTKAAERNDQLEVRRINKALNDLVEPAKINAHNLNEAQKILDGEVGKLEQLKTLSKQAKNGKKVLKLQNAEFTKKLKPFYKTVSVVMRQKWVAKIVELTAKFVGSPIGAALQIPPLYFVICDITKDMQEWDALYQRITKKLPCKGMQAEAKALQFMVGQGATVFIKTSFNQLKADVIGLSLDFLDVPATPQWYISVGCDVYSTVISLVRPYLSNKSREALRKSIDALDCKEKPKPDPKPDPKPTKPTNTTPPPSDPPSNTLGGLHRWGNQTILRTTPIHVLPGSKAWDPSGFVYEAVNSNRLEGVTATCYHKQMLVDEWGDMYEDDVVWLASSYHQENPLITDSEGRYAWDVPQGMWQVRYEKDGYELKRSEWLPVPPPQLDVNVGMTQLRQPQVSQVRAYPEGIDITFDKYMRPHTLTTEKIFLTQDGQLLNGTIQLLNADTGYETPDSVYASKVRFVPSTPLTKNDKVQLTVHKSVESYAGMQMESDYTQPFDVELRVLSIETDSLLYMADDAAHSLTIQALPTEAAKGKSLSVTTMNPDIVATSADALTLDANGQAQVTLTATGLGTSAVKFALTDDDLTASTIVHVADAENMVVDEPTASRMSGTEIYRGSGIKLTCRTAGVTILYTLDGSCPCDANSKSVLTYTGPIVATGENMVIRAMAVANGMGESDVVEFRYKVIDPPVYIETITTDDGVEMRVPVAYYQLDGRRMSKLGRGINIVRRANGTIDKVLVK